MPTETEGGEIQRSRSRSRSRSCSRTAEQGLDEVIAAQVIEENRSSNERSRLSSQLQRRITAESTLSSSRSYRGLTEVEAPLPAPSVEHEDSLEHEIRVSNASEAEFRTEEKNKAEREMGLLTSKQRKLRSWHRRLFKIGDIKETLLWLILFSIFGVLARIGLISLESYPGKSVDGLVWVQFIGCLIMGFLSETKDMFALNNGRSLQLYVGLSTGFCGSLTTFSSWMKAAFLAMANAEPHNPRPRGYSVLGLLDEIILTLCLSLGGIKVGAHVGLLLRSSWTKLRHKDNDNSGKGNASVKLGFAIASGYKVLTGLKWLALILGVGCWIGAVLMAVFIDKWRGKVLFAIVFGPLGTITRWLFSRYLNPMAPSFPVGTFTANIFGTSLIALFSIAQQRIENRTGCQVLQGMMDGYCGCLTTVSTFALELQTLKRKHAWRYGAASVICGIVIMVLTLGVDHWRFRELTEQSC
ncbi:CrcB-like protein-domain-containing protein [Lipomyces japonicus]|uniref:CrcB-like protein-domain-containing protein n=1 Tax=Lipomyces japonicus TaxID=56871 RepID=UPI0034CD904D